MHTRAALLAAVLLTRGLSAQSVEVGNATQVRSIEFEVLGRLGVGRDVLRDQIAVRGRGGAVGLRRTFGWLPFVPGVEERFFDPLELQRDRERLRRFLGRVGYPEAEVDYDVTPRSDEDAVEVRFLVRPGEPLLVRSIELRWLDGPAGLDTAAARSVLRRGLTLREGDPLDIRALPPAATGLTGWLGDRGHAFAEVRPVPEADSGPRAARVVFEVTAGPRARLAGVDIVETGGLSEDFIRRFLNLEAGEWFSTLRLHAASQRLTGLEIVRDAVFEIPAEQPVDTLIRVSLRVHRVIPREVSGQAGYSTEGGLAGEAQWTHRGILGGGQSLTATLSGESGVLALPENANRFARASFTFRQPLRSTSQLSLLIGPFTEYRSDFRDRSLQIGLETTLLYRLGPLSSVSLRHQLATRRVYEYGFGDISNGLDFLELLQLASQGILDRYGTRINTSDLTLSAAIGTLDAPTEPRRGFVIQPSVTTMLPGAWNTNQYVTANLRASLYIPLSSAFSVGIRAGAGRLWPFGKSVPADSSEATIAYFRLRDALFTAGGTRDVRGWGEGLLGPIFPQIILHRRSDGSVGFSADRYAPLGGFNRVHGTLELRGPVPLLGPAWGSHLFLDAGRIWTHDRRFSSPDDPYGVRKLFWGVGGGIDYITPIGAVRLSLGYKLNPSILDLANPADVTRAIVDGTPLTQVRQHNGRRFQLHVGIGRRL